MPVYQANDTVEIQILYSGLSGRMMNVIFVEMKIATPFATTLKDYIRSDYWAAYKGAISNRCSIIGIKSRRVTPEPVTSYVEENFAIDNGGVISNVAWEGTSSIIVLRHGLIPLARTGRMFLPYSGLGYINGAYDTSGVSRLDTACNNLNAKFATTGNSIYFRQMVRGKVGGGYVYRPVTQYTWRPYLGSQRRRRPGVGA